jgi:ABC-type transport system involved in Fe-S cluster assembly fused permease/ATPase subunit
VGKALIDMENMFELLATPPAIQDVPGARPLGLATGRVDFQDVVFGYSAAAPVLKGVSFSAAGGSTVAVVGSTGSGKSTILRLLLRLYDPQAGRVLIDGQDISRVTQDSVRRAIAVVPQDTVLFNDTILYNIRYGRPSASDSQVGGGGVEEGVVGLAAGVMGASWRRCLPQMSAGGCKHGDPSAQVGIHG